MTTPATDFDTLAPTTEMPLLVANGEFRGTHAGCTFAKKCDVTEVRVTAATRLLIADDTPQMSALHFIIERDAELTLTHISLGGGGEYRVTFDLTGEGATVACATLLASSADVTRYEFTTHHRAPRTTSIERARCIASGDARIAWLGHVDVPHASPDCRIRQDNKNLLLSDTATIIAKPELDIEIDAVEASHGSATGALDPEAMLYLASRGISDGEARRLLTLAFAGAVLDDLPTDVRELVIARFSEKIMLI